MQQILFLLISLQWLTPDGCAIFTLQLNIPLSSPLGQRIPLLQHLVSIATAKAVTNLPNYQVITFHTYQRITNNPVANLFDMKIKSQDIRDILWFLLCISFLIRGKVDNLITLQFTIRINAFAHKF